jgi:hypothetical protein
LYFFEAAQVNLVLFMGAEAEGEKKRHEKAAHTDCFSPFTTKRMFAFLKNLTRSLLYLTQRTGHKLEKSGVRKERAQIYTPIMEIVEQSNVLLQIFTIWEY